MEFVARIDDDDDDDDELERVVEKRLKEQQIIHKITMYRVLWANMCIVYCVCIVCEFVCVLCVYCV